jgi:hypothetical protein
VTDSVADTGPVWYDWVMGTWGDGIYDNDGSLDLLGNLIAIEGEEREAARLVARIGLLAWLHPVSVTHGHNQLLGRLKALRRGLAGLPAETCAALEALLDDPKTVTEKGSRTLAVREAIGGYSNGPRLDALLRFPGAQGPIDELGERAAVRLDKALEARGPDLYEIAGEMGALGVVVELSQAGFWRPASTRVAVWRAGFDAIDQATKSERSFWWKYARRVRHGFDLIGPKTPWTAAPAGPVRRFTHPQFGPATLLASSGSGDDEKLELCFDGGVVRKLLAKFVTEVET